MLSTFNLLEKRNTFSRSLSGGMKRKLAIIIALIGGSQVLRKREWGGGEAQTMGSCQVGWKTQLRKP